jgi:hypothetical protein
MLIDRRLRPDIPAVAGRIRCFNNRPVAQQGGSEMVEFDIEAFVAHLNPRVGVEWLQGLGGAEEN